MSFNLYASHLEMAVDQLEGLVKANDEGKSALHIARGARVGAFMALVSIAHDVHRIADLLERSQSVPASLGLKISVVNREVLSMDPITAFTATDALKCVAAPKDASGNPVAATLSWTVDHPQLVSLSVAADGLSASGTLNSPGTATISVTDGVITESQVVNVVAGSAPPPPPTPAATLGLSVTVVPKS